MVLSAGEKFRQSAFIFDGSCIGPKDSEEKAQYGGKK
jgi:hypothetical protein